MNKSDLVDVTDTEYHLIINFFSLKGTISIKSIVYYFFIVL